MTLIEITHPERWWLAISRDLPPLADPIHDDWLFHHRDAVASAWASIAGVVEQIGQMIVAGDYTVPADDPALVHVEVDLDGLDERDQEIVADWFRGAGASPSIDPGDEALWDRRHRLWPTWKASPQAVLPVYSKVLARLDEVDLDTDGRAGSVITQARTVLANSSPALLERSRAYADEIRRAAEHGGPEGAAAAEPGDQDYLDRVTVTVEFREHPSLPALEQTWTIEAELYAVSDVKAWLRREMREIASSDGGGCCGKGTYEMTSRDLEREWGSAALAFELVTTLVPGLMTAAAWAALCRVAARLSRKLEPALHSAPDTLDQDALIHAARTTAVIDKGLDSGVLRVAECTLEEGEHAGSVKLEDTTTGNTYTVETIAYRNSVKISRVKSWTYAP